MVNAITHRYDQTLRLPGLADGDPAFRFRIERFLRVAYGVKSINITAGQTASQIAQDHR
jgi:hypothetical protein